MAKASMKAREEKRRKTVLRYAAKRAELKEIFLEALREFHDKPNYSPYRLDELQE